MVGAVRTDVLLAQLAAVVVFGAIVSSYDSTLVLPAIITLAAAYPVVRYGIEAVLLEAALFLLRAARLRRDARLMHAAKYYRRQAEFLRGDDVQ